MRSHREGSHGLTHLHAAHPTSPSPRGATRTSGWALEALGVKNLGKMSRMSPADNVSLRGCLSNYRSLLLTRFQSWSSQRENRRMVPLFQGLPRELNREGGHSPHPHTMCQEAGHLRTSGGAANRWLLSTFPAVPGFTGAQTAGAPQQHSSWGGGRGGVDNHSAQGARSPGTRRSKGSCTCLSSPFIWPPWEREVHPGLFQSMSLTPLPTRRLLLPC